MPQERLPKQALLAKANAGRRPVGRFRTRWTDYIEDLGWNLLGLRPSKMMEVMEDREVWQLNLELLPQQLEMETGRVDRPVGLPVGSRFFDRPVKPVEIPVKLSFLANKKSNTNRNTLIYVIINKTFYKKTVLTNHAFWKHLLNGFKLWLICCDHFDMHIQERV